mgnify:CR=1 FL=1
MKDLGVAGTIGVVQLSGAYVDGDINRWLELNPDVEIIDIKFAANATSEDWNSEALIIYRKEI